MIVNGNRVKWQPGREWLEQKYINEQLTLAEIGKESGVSAGTVMRALDALAIPRRDPKERNHKRGSSNGNWKKSGASYSALHKRIYKILGKANHCEECGRTDNETKYNWANLTGELDNPKDYASLCRRCHIRFDRNRRKSPCNKPVSNILRIRGIQ